MEVLQALLGFLRNDLTWRAYRAAVVGPFRRVHGAVRNVTNSAGAPTVLLAAARGDVVLSVTVAVNANALVSFTRTDGSATPASCFAAAMTIGVVQHFVLLPGEELYAGTAPGTSLIVSEVQF